MKFTCIYVWDITVKGRYIAVRCEVPCAVFIKRNADISARIIGIYGSRKYRAAHIKIKGRYLVNNNIALNSLAGEGHLHISAVLSALSPATGRTAAHYPQENAV